MVGGAACCRWPILPGEQRLPEGREEAQHQVWPVQRGLQGLEASCSSQWKVLAGGFLLDTHPSHEAPQPPSSTCPVLPAWPGLVSQCSATWHTFFSSSLF